MSRFSTTLPPDYFDALYASDPDPWRFAESEYERAKYAATLDALPRASYARALEIGCSIGVLTEKLAPRCGALVALDVAEAALAQAMERCRALPHVAFARMHVPAAWPEGRFDLILLSEVVYYLDREGVAALAERIRASMGAGGDIVLVHWLGETHYPLSGDEAVDLLTAALDGFAIPAFQARQAAYRLDVLRAEPTGRAGAAAPDAPA